MVKLGKVFSIILVFALLIVLAPALVPRAASAVGPGPNLPNPLTVTFDADVAYTGSSLSFNVVPDPVNGSMGMQFSREGVLYNSSLTDCKFYNISAASGTIGGDLSGDIDLEWNRLDLTMPYPNITQQYVSTPDGFGLLYIKGNLTTAELGDFKFIGVADLDYAGTTVKGAGRMCTVIPWENPALVNYNGSLEEVLIGEITDYTLTASKISGTLNLRYYNKTKGEIANNWSYMYLEGVLGGDLPDNITGPPNTGSLIQYTQANLVPTDNTKTLAMEEAHPGRETPSRLTAGYLGENGTITLRRTGIYAYVHVGDPDPAGMNLPAQSVHAIKNTLDNWVCNDTAFRGKSHSVVGVDMVNFDEFGVDQQSYSYMLSYSPGYEGEGYFKGFESWSVSATHITLLSEVFGSYYDFVLRPTPVINSVSPNVGQAGTFNVTINGKWFLVDPVYHTLNVTFGDPNITVNNHQMIDDTQINVNITIAGGAGVCASDINVTKLGVTGTMTDGFGVGSAVDGLVAFAGRPAAPDDTWIEMFDVTVFDDGTTDVVWAGSSFTNDTGVFTVTGLTPGTYDIGIKNFTCLSELETNVVLTLGATTVADFTSVTREGDANNDDWVTGADRSILYTGWGSSKGSPSYGWEADFNRDEWLTGADRSMMYTYWGQSGALA